MLYFEMDVIAADTEQRTIEGRIVPYDEVAEIRGVKYRFRPGSITAARSRTPLLLDHDRLRPVGVLAELREHPSGALGRFKVDPTAAGDEALAQAASGSRGAFSIGASVEASEGELEGVVDVTAGRVHEVSLLALGAFEGAAVTRVAAEQDEPEPEPEPEPDPEPAPPAEEQEAMEMEAAIAAPMILAAADPPARELKAGELVGLMIRAQQGEPDARRYLEAALSETISTNVTGLLPPQYERTVIGAKDIARPLYNAFRGRPLPGVGLQVSKPKWTTPPSGAWAATVDADATSSTVIIGSQTADVARWDWAGAISWVVVQRSDPSIIDEIYSEAVQDFYLDVEAKIYAELSAAGPGVATSLGGAIAEFYTATGDQRTPDVILMAPDVWGAFADTGALSVPLAQGAVSGDLSTSFAGIPAIVSGTLAAGETILATKRAVDARVTEPVRLTANAIGALNVELAVVGEGLFDTDYPAELLKFAAITPALAQASGRSSRSS